MKEWFEGLQPRERLMLMAGGTALVIMLFYLPQGREMILMFAHIMIRASHFLMLTP